MILKKCLFVLFLLACIDSTIQAKQHFVFRDIDTSDGLSDNTVKCITQDNRGFIWFGTFNGLCRFDGVEFSVFRHNPNDSLSLLNNRVSALLPVENGMWVGTDEGLNFFSYEDNRFYPCEQISTAGKTQRIKQSIKSIVAINEKIFVLVAGKLFVRQHNQTFEKCDYNPDTYWMSISTYKDKFLLAHARNGLYLIDTENQTIADSLLYEVNTVSDVVFYSHNRDIIYIGYGLGNATETFKINNGKCLERIAVYAPAGIKMITDYNEKTLFATDGNGLLCYNQDIVIAYTPKNSNILSDAIFSLYVDKDNNLWVGTYRSGVDLYSNQYERFLSLTVSNKQLTHNIVTAIWVDNGQIFAGLDGGGLNIYDVKSGKVSSYTTQNSRIAGDNVLSLAKDEEYIWLGIYNKGLCRYSLSEHTFRTYRLPPSKNVEYNTIWEIKDDGNGNIWTLGTNVYLFDKKAETFTLINKQEEYYVSGMALDGNEVWISSIKNGLYKLNQKTGDVLQHYTKESKPLSITNNVTRHVFVDSKHNVWFVADNAGLYKLNEKQEEITCYGIKNGLTDRNVTSILEDKGGNLWVATLNGLFKFNSLTETFVRFGIEDNMPSAQFNYNACFKDNETLYLGSTKGLVYFNPEEITYDKPFNPVYFTGFELLTGEKDVIHLYSDTPEEIRLTYSQNFFTIHFSVPELVSPDKLFFSCYIQNFEQDWRDISYAREVTYSNVPPGRYIFRIRSTDRDGKWSANVSELQIVVTPPWWKTGWAYALWIIITLGILTLILLFYINRININQLVKLKEAENDMIKRVNEVKLRFFTNISHEFRTPLSLIISPLEALIKHEKDDTHRLKLSKIHKNAKDLLNLVNQLLDFRKLEIKGESLHLTYGDLVEFTDVAYQTFTEMADNEQKDLNLSIKVERLYMAFDKDKVRKILNNLLSNAFKYTSAGAQITLSLNKTKSEEKEYALIQVTDTGTGIPADKLPHIFERFYQLENAKSNTSGSGVGLHLVKEYVNLHEGKIEVESVLHKGSTFTVWLPAGLHPATTLLREEAESAGITEVVNASFIGENKKTAKKTLLIVEDSDEFRQFLVEQLEPEYRIVQATDGEDGELQVLKHSPDLVITDIMMPKVDGIELCWRIKNNIQISHIPIILLTARSSDESRLVSYEAGADEYISKPFNLDILLLRIRGLIAKQEERKAQFRKNLEVNPCEITITSLDEQFIRKTLSFIEKNMSNTEYFIDDLSKDTGMSKTNLYNKIQSITGLAPAQFIRSIRLKRAAQLLRDTQLNISEIADSCGFGTIKYFNIHFKEEFGITPTQYRRKM
jgi:signal transduction histidine kinase/DNA-binding response OmpR family regulator/ligand-binding sensor domain-containing protein